MLENAEHKSRAHKVNIFKVDNQGFKIYYDMQNPLFRNFMIEVVMNLEPLSMHKGTEMINEMDEVNEIIFVHKGNVGVGYELNKIKKMVI